MPDPNPPSMNRRQFVARTGAAAVTFSILKPGVVRGSAANTRVKLGLIGCGGRGSWIASLFRDHGGYEITAIADYFRDRADAGGEKFDVPASRRFTGLSAYRQLLESGVDAIAIESPPYFHPEQAAAGVAAGKHVYLAKPVAVDVPGCRTVEASARAAAENGLAFLVDFQTRADPYYIEALRRIHEENALGTFAFGEASYHAGSPWDNQLPYLLQDPHDPENRLRAWGVDRALSGDIITEQNIHTLDVMNWIMDAPPRYAHGTGSHKVRTDPGTCWDHFAVLFQYPDDVGITFSSRQFEGHGSPGGILNRMFGSRGVLETAYGGDVRIRGEAPFEGGKTTGIYQEGAVQNIATFYDSIQNGRYDQPTVAPSVQSNLITILGRQAAYDHRKVTWDELLGSTARLEADLEGLKA